MSKIDRELRLLHRRMRLWEAAGEVEPPPITNRRTGEITTFGPRRCFDGAWVMEMLGASGCTKAEINAAIFVLEPLIEFGVTINSDLLKLLAWYYEPPSKEELARHWRSQLHIVGDDPPPAA